MSPFMKWLMLTHTQRWQAAHDRVGGGPIYQGRFRSFPIQRNDHLSAVLRYVEANPLRADVAARAENWRWSSLWRRM